MSEYTPPATEMSLLNKPIHVCAAILSGSVNVLSFKPFQRRHNKNHQRKGVEDKKGKEKWTAGGQCLHQVDVQQWRRRSRRAAGNAEPKQPQAERKLLHLVYRHKGACVDWLKGFVPPKSPIKTCNATMQVMLGHIKCSVD